MMDEDIYFKKEVTLKHAEETLRFRVSQTLFSSHRVDTGTAFLLRTLSGGFRKVLDLGCGYGPLGLTLKKLNPDAAVHLVDRDALAVAYARQNAELNRLDSVEAYGSLGYDDVQERDFDLVVSNIPGKAGEPAISSFLRDAAGYLVPGGLVAVVVVAALEPAVSSVLGATPGIDIILGKERSGHAVFHYRFAEREAGDVPAAGSSLERGIYHRDHLLISSRGLEYRVETVRGLPEFDSLGYHTELLLAGMQRVQPTAPARALVFNPGQGHVPVALWKLMQPENMVLVGRDLLALRCSEMNLVRNGCPAENIALRHCVGLDIDDDTKADIIVCNIDKDEGPAANAQSVRQAVGMLAPGGSLLVAGTSTVITRLADIVHGEKLLSVRERKKSKGYGLLVLASA